MKLRTLALMGTLGILLGCESSVEYTPNARQAATAEAPERSDDQRAVTQTQEPEDVDEVADNMAEEVEPVENSTQPLTNADLLAMDEVVITAVISGQATQYFSDVGNTAVTTAETVANASESPTGQRMTAESVLDLRAGQRMTFCNHASSDARLRVHAANGSAFGHWGNGQQLDPGQCSTGLGYPEVLNANAVGNTPGNNLYDHNQGNGNGQRNGAIFININ